LKAERAWFPRIRLSLDKAWPMRIQEMLNVEARPLLWQNEIKETERNMKKLIFMNKQRFLAKRSE